MKKNINEFSRIGANSQQARHQEQENTWKKVRTWWICHLTPPEPPLTASIIQREKVRRARTASVIVALLMLFLASILPTAMINHNAIIIVAALSGLCICILALFLNRMGAIEIAGVLTLALIYLAQIFIMLSYSGGMTLGRLSLLDFTIIPYVVVLAFFPVNSLFLLTGLNLVLTWGFVMLTPHNATIGTLLKTDPLQIFAHVYILQLLVAAALYLWARSTEQAIRRADHAEEIANLEKREKERQQQELERMHQLDSGIEQILQTHIAVANGDLSARAPLSQEHMLWQVALALNNLIGRIQRLTDAENSAKTDLATSNKLHAVTALPKRDLPLQRRQTQAVRAMAPLTPPQKEKGL